MCSTCGGPEKIPGKQPCAPGIFPRFFTAILNPKPKEMRRPAQQTFSTSSPITRSMFYPAPPFPQARLFPAQSYPPQDGCPRPCPMPLGRPLPQDPDTAPPQQHGPAMKPHSEHNPGLRTSSPSLTIATTNTWRGAKPHSIWQALPSQVNFTLNVSAFSASSGGNTTQLHLTALKDSVMRALTARTPLHTAFIL